MGTGRLRADEEKRGEKGSGGPPDPKAVGGAAPRCGIRQRSRGRGGAHDAWTCKGRRRRRGGREKEWGGNWGGAGDRGWPIRPPQWVVRGTGVKDCRRRIGAPGGTAAAERPAAAPQQIAGQRRVLKEGKRAAPDAESKQPGGAMSRPRTRPLPVARSRRWTRAERWCWRPRRAASSTPTPPRHAQRVANLSFESRARLPPAHPPPSCPMTQLLPRTQSAPQHEQHTAVRPAAWALSPWVLFGGNRLKIGHLLLSSVQNKGMSTCPSLTPWCQHHQAPKSNTTYQRVFLYRFCF